MRPNTISSQLGTDARRAAERARGRGVTTGMAGRSRAAGASAFRASSSSASSAASEGVPAGDVVVGGVGGVGRSGLGGVGDLGRGVRGRLRRLVRPVDDGLDLGGGRGIGVDTGRALVRGILSGAGLVRGGQAALRVHGGEAARGLVLAGLAVGVLAGDEVGEGVVGLHVRAHALAAAHPQDLQQVGVPVRPRGGGARRGDGLRGVGRDLALVVLGLQRGVGGGAGLGAGEHVPGLGLGEDAGPRVPGLQVAAGRAEGPQGGRLLAGGQAGQSRHGETGGHGPAALLAAPGVPLQGGAVHADLGEAVAGEEAEGAGPAVLDDVRVEVRTADPDLHGLGLLGHPAALSQHRVAVGADAGERVAALPGHLLHGGAGADALLDLTGERGSASWVAAAFTDSWSVSAAGEAAAGAASSSSASAAGCGVCVGGWLGVDARGQGQLLVRTGGAGGVLARAGRVIVVRRFLARGRVLLGGLVHLRQVVPGGGCGGGVVVARPLGVLEHEAAQVGGQGQRVLGAVGIQQAQGVAVLGGSGQSQLCHGGGPSHVVFSSPGARTPGRAFPDPSGRAARRTPTGARRDPRVRRRRDGRSSFGRAGAMVHNLRATAQAGPVCSGHGPVPSLPGTGPGAVPHQRSVRTPWPPTTTPLGRTRKS